MHLLRRLHLLQLDALDPQPRLVVVEQILENLLGLALDLSTLLGEQPVDGGAADHLSNRRLRCVAQGRTRVGDAIARLKGILDPVLHHEPEAHDVVPLGLHRHLAPNRLSLLWLCAEVRAEFLALESRHVHDHMGLERRGPVPTEPGLAHGAPVLSELQDHGRLPGLELVDSEVAPESQHQQRDDDHEGIRQQARDVTTHGFVARSTRFAARHQEKWIRRIAGESRLGTPLDRATPRRFTSCFPCRHPTSRRRRPS